MELKKHKNRGIYAPAKISQLKESPYEKRLSLQKNFAAKRAIMRKWGYAAKRGSPCKTISQPQDPPCETTLRHMCAILQPKSPFRSYEMSCETTCEIPLLLRKFQPSFEYLFKPLNSYVSFRTAILTYEKPLQVQNSTKIRGPFPREVQRTSI